MKRNATRTALVCLALAAMLLTGCAGKAAPAPEPTATPEPTPIPPAELALGEALTVTDDVGELTLAEGEYDYDSLLEALPRFKALASLSLPETRLSLAQMEALEAAAPETDVDYSVVLHGLEFARDAEVLDLSWMTKEDLSETLPALALLREVRSAELMDAEGNSDLEKADVHAVMDALPQAKVHYEFDFFGQRLSTLDERVEFDHIELTDADEPLIREALDILPCCSYFKLDEDKPGISDEIMASIRDDYPQAGVTWRIFIEYVNILTDEEILRVTNMLTNESSKPLQYCTNAVYLDVGHNEAMSDLSFVANMPRLECVIISGAKNVDLNDFANCKNLIWMECCFCPKLEDISALADHPTLKYLNVSFTKVRDISMLDNVALERMVAMPEWLISAEDRARFEELHPDCLTAWVGEQPYGYPWRYNSIPAVTSNFFEYYKEMRLLFCYDDLVGLNSKRSKHGPGYLSVRDPNWESG